LNSDAKPCKTKEPKGLSGSITTDLFKVIGESINKGKTDLYKKLKVS
jgi:hypothetical protein